MAAIVLEHVVKAYPDGTVAVDDLNLEIADGEFVILVGPSGCGKSTTLNMIAGLEEITSGELRIDGRRVNDAAPRDRDIAMVFQSYALYPNMTVRENMAFPLRLAKLDRAEIDRKVREVAGVLELTPYLDRRPAGLSGGQRQRVAMGRAIVRSPKAFLMDEPLSNLDAKLRIQMRVQVSRLQRRLATTMVYVTHDQTEAMTLGDRVVVMRGGVVQQAGDPQRLYDEPANLFVAGFIGSPAMNFLPVELDGDRLRTALGELPLGDRLRRRLTAVPPGPGRAGGTAPRQLILGVRPEHLIDADLAGESGPDGVVFEAPVDVAESTGSDKFVYLPVAGERAAAADLDELAADAGTEDLTSGGNTLVARFPATSRARAGGRARVRIDLDRAHLFDPADGRNLTAHAAP